MQAPGDLEERLARTRSLRKGQIPCLLIVDDEDDFLELGELFLGGDGWSVVKARSADEALLAVRANPPDFALVDLFMPGRDGFSVLRDLRGEPATRDIPVFATTAAELDDAPALLRIGFDGHFPKPIDWPGLRKMLKALAGL